MNETVKIAKLELQKARITAFTEVTKALLANPVVELVGAFALIEYLQRTPKNRPIIGNTQGNLMEAGISGIITVQQLAPSLPYLAQAGGDFLSAIGKLAPGLGMLIPK